MRVPIVDGANAAARVETAGGVTGRGAPAGCMGKLSAAALLKDEIMLAIDDDATESVVLGSGTAPVGVLRRTEGSQRLRPDAVVEY